MWLGFLTGVLATIVAWAFLCWSIRQWGTGCDWQQEYTCRCGRRLKLSRDDKLGIDVARWVEAPGKKGGENGPAPTADRPEPPPAPTKPEEEDCDLVKLLKQEARDVFAKTFPVALKELESQRKAQDLAFKELEASMKATGVPRVVTSYILPPDTEPWDSPANIPRDAYYFRGKCKSCDTPLIAKYGRGLPARTVCPRCDCRQAVYSANVMWSGSGKPAAAPCAGIPRSQAAIQLGITEEAWQADKDQRAKEAKISAQFKGAGTDTEEESLDRALASLTRAGRMVRDCGYGAGILFDAKPTPGAPDTDVDKDCPGDEGSISTMRKAISTAKALLKSQKQAIGRLEACTDALEHEGLDIKCPHE